MADEKAILLIPAYDEAKTMPYVMRQAMTLKTAGTVAEVVVVDDGSTDRTAQIARESGAQVISIGKNVGKGGAVLQGLLHCKNSGAHAVVLADADIYSGLTQTQVLFLLEQLRIEGADMVVYPQFELDFDDDVASSSTQTTRQFSGFRAIRMKGLDFIFQRNGNGWGFSNCEAADFFIKAAQGYGLEIALNHQFANSMVFLPQMHGQMLLGPMLRGERNKRQYLDLQHTNNMIEQKNRRAPFGLMAK